jgi:hypothetical protein
MTAILAATLPMHNISWTALGDVGSVQTETFTISGSCRAGDVVILFDRGNNSASEPAAVTPAGFTNLDTKLSPSGFAKFMVSYKILNPADPGAVFTGMVGTINTNKIVAGFRPNLAQPSLRVSTPTSQVTDGDPSEQSILASAATTPCVAIAVTSCLGVAITSPSFSPSEDATLQIGSPNLIMKYKVMNSSPSDITIDQIDSGAATSNYLAGFYFQNPA